MTAFAPKPMTYDHKAYFQEPTKAALKGCTLETVRDNPVSYTHLTLPTILRV